MRGKPDRIFHYCCAHSAVDIRRDGFVDCAENVLQRRSPEKHVEHTSGYVVWLTDLEPPVMRDAVGLTMHTIDCDRTKYCFEVVPDWGRIEWWMTFRKRHTEMHKLESEPGVMPMHWWVGRGPLPVLRELPV